MNGLHGDIQHDEIEESLLANMQVGGWIPKPLANTTEVHPIYGPQPDLMARVWLVNFPTWLLHQGDWNELVLGQVPIRVIHAGGIQEFVQQGDASHLLPPIAWDFQGQREVKFRDGSISQ